MSLHTKIAAALLAAGMTALIATPAMAAEPGANTNTDQDSNFGGGVNEANNWNFTAAAVCFQELAVVPVGGDWVGSHANHCKNGNVLNHSH